MIFKKILELIFFGLVYLFDFFTWILIKILPKKILFKILSKKYRFPLKVKLNKSRQILIINKFSYFLNIRSTVGNIFSSCLSRSITGKIFLSLFGIKCQINLCMIKTVEGYKIPHSWLEVENNKFIITGFISDSKIEPLYFF